MLNPRISNDVQLNRRCDLSGNRFHSSGISNQVMPRVLASFFVMLQSVEHQHTKSGIKVSFVFLSHRKRLLNARRDLPRDI